MDKSIFKNKRPHQLFKSQNLNDFIERMEETVGSQSTWHPSQFIESNVLEGLILGGSIPRGFADSASDVDFIAVLTKSSNIPIAFPKNNYIEYTNIKSIGKTDVSAAVVLAVNGVEIEIKFISMNQLRTIFENVQSSNTLPPPEDMQLIERLKYGWILSETTEFEKFLNLIKSSKIIEIRTCVNQYVNALKTLEDARANQSNHPLLAIYLGRLCVERLMKSYFAAHGELFIGDKWLRLTKNSINAKKSSKYKFIIDECEKLLFSAIIPSKHSVKEYLNSVREIASQIKYEIELESSYKIAFHVCTHIDDPMIFS